jgi:hypothetical protein
VRYVLHKIVAENWRIQHGEIPPWGAGGMVTPSDVWVGAFIDPATGATEYYRVNIPV